MDLPSSGVALYIDMRDGREGQANAMLPRSRLAKAASGSSFKGIVLQWLGEKSKPDNGINRRTRLRYGR
ncbi:MAG: hypothetical protein K2Q10_05055, partial [Rhodospirillales bacterium]|nr:hypothetical protein [Rhodospirillales bacterium]